MARYAVFRVSVLVCRADDGGNEALARLFQPERNGKPVTHWDRLTEEDILRGLGTKKIGLKCRVFQEIDSTNDQAKRMADAGAAEGLTLVAEKQLKGRGRLQRPWAAAEGTGLWFSIILRPAILPENAAEIGFAAAVAVCEAVKVYTGIACFLKWPNDILWEGKKLCGILTETSGRSDKVNHVVVGIGLNVNQNRGDFPEDLADKAVSLAMASGTSWHRTPLLQQILRSVEAVYADYLTRGFAHVLDRWRSLCGIFNKPVRVGYAEEIIEGIALDVDEQGALLISTPAGVRRVTVGDVSIADNPD
jgi:BirA family biotin operon repressor/biotin-[acetyl-CoA-carboxylase] ligase